MYKYIPCFVLETVAYSLNFFFPTLILIFTSFSKNYELSSELGIVISLSYFTTQIFSANSRSIIMSKENSYKLLNYTFFYRFFLSCVIILGLVYFSLSSTINSINKFLLLNISMLITLQWVVEIILLKFELKKEKKFIFNFIIFYISAVILYLVTILLSKKFSNNLIVLVNIVLLILIINHFFQQKIELNKKIFFKKIIIKFYLGYSFLSSFFIQLTNLIWRILILIFCGKVIAGIYFSSFAIGSLFSTLFNISFGPSLLKKKIFLGQVFKKIVILYLFSILISILIWSKYFFLVSSFESNLFFFTIIASLVGSLVMLKAVYDRQKFIQINKKKVFQLDMFYSLFLIILIPLLNLIGGKMLIMLSFFMSSLISYFLFSIILKKLLNKGTNITKV